MYIGLQPISKHQLGIFVRLQPPGHQPCLVKAPTLDLGAPTPRTPILLILRHQPQGLEPSAIYFLDMFSSYSLLPTLLDLRLTSILLLASLSLDIQLLLYLHRLSDLWLLNLLTSSFIHLTFWLPLFLQVHEL